MFCYNSFFQVYIFWALYGFIDSTGTDMTGNRMRERGIEMQQRAPGSNLCQLQHPSVKHSLMTFV